MEVRRKVAVRLLKELQVGAGNLTWQDNDVTLSLLLP